MLMLYGAMRLKIMNRLVVSQKRAIRTICHSDFLAHTNDLFKRLGLLKVDDISILESVKFVKKEITKPRSLYFHPYKNNHGMNLRNNLQLNVNLPQPRSELARRFITYYGAFQWNNLPRELKVLQHPLTFKKNVKKHLISRY